MVIEPGAWLVLAKAVAVTFTALLPVINRVGTAIILLGMTKRASEATRRGMARSVAVNAAMLLTVLLLAGSYLLSFFGISVPIVQTAGGLLLVSIGWNLLNAKETESLPDHLEGAPHESYSAKVFYPFTFPITVGPGAIASWCASAPRSPGAGSPC